ncbi:pilin [Candidatus Wolfebacteria bacterium]|nr:pilin [Candidatus Wolfebacteria bacterium]
MKTFQKVLILTGAALLPVATVHAQLGNIEDIVDGIGRIVSLLTPIVVGIALLAFFWGLAKFIFSAGDEEARKAGKQIMIYGIIALFIMISIWGIVRFIGDALDIDPERNPGAVPGVPIP